MELTGLIAQRAIVLPVLAHAHATLSPGSSMGQLLMFESAIAPIVTELTAAMKARRVTRALQKALPVLSEASGLIAAEELADVVEEARGVLRETQHAQGSFDGTITAQAVLVMAAIDRARLACGVVLDLCEMLGTAPNGKPLRDAVDGAPNKDARQGAALFDTAL